MPLKQSALDDEPDDDELDDELDDDKIPTPAKFKDYVPTKTRSGRGRIVLPRTEFTFSCPTSVQCNDGGCCQIGDYCAIRDGNLGCCPEYGFLALLQHFSGRKVTCVIQVDRCVMHPPFREVGRKLSRTRAL